MALMGRNVRVCTEGDDCRFLLDISRKYYEGLSSQSEIDTLQRHTFCLPCQPVRSRRPRKLLAFVFYFIL